MTYMLLLNCALKLVEEIILYYDARSKKHKKSSLSYHLLEITEGIMGAMWQRELVLRYCFT